jgi:hypothetical protein
MGWNIFTTTHVVRYCESALNRASGSIFFENYLSLRFQGSSKRSAAANFTAIANGGSFSPLINF